MALYRSKKNGKNRFHLINVDSNYEQISFESSSDIVSQQDLIDKNEKRENSENKTPYDALIENFPCNVLVFSLTDRVRVAHANDWTSRFTGFSKEELKKIQEDDVTNLAHNEDKAMLKQMIKDIYAGKDKIHAIYRVRCKDGTFAHVSLNASVIERTKNKIVFHGIETDVDEIFKLKCSIKNSRKRLNKFHDIIPSGIFEIIVENSEFEVVHYNNWFSNLLGYSHRSIEMFSDDELYSFISKEDIKCFKEGVEKMKLGEDFIEIYYRLNSKLGDVYPVRMNMILIKDDENRFNYLGVITKLD